MKKPIVAMLGFYLSLAQPAAAQEEGWRLIAATPEHGLQLAYGAQYLFECGAEDVKITQFGVTQLLDLQTGTKVGDGPGAKMTQGAALMALYGGDGTPDLRPATAVANPAKGWDMTIHIAKNDKQLKRLGRAQLVSLFTTGYTAAVAMSDQDRARATQFVEGCKGAK